MMALFEAQALGKRFGDQVVLERIDLAFEQGRLHGIMGPNGAGKTTCFNVLTGRYPPDRGQIRFDGEDITGLSPRRIARRGIARSFQVINLFDEYSAIENVLMALPTVRDRGFNVLRWIGRGSAEMDEAATILERVGLKGREYHPSASLPYGERRALEIGIALACEPRILFLDEPTSGMGIDGTARLTELIASLKARYTIVIIEHDMSFLFRLADRISVIHWGQVIAEGTPSELQRNPWVRRSNLGEPS